MQFIEIARRLEIHALSVCIKAPKRYTQFLTSRIMELASTVHEEVRAANNIYPTNQHEAQMRRDHLTNANIALQNLSPKLALLYDAILNNPEGYDWIDNAMKVFGEYIVDEAQLISKVKKADRERYKNLPE
jgi:3'-phosphoadenosine 5'-phosphosulfate sulfotransferase (PAPS reductase)/FAD synthetase